MNEAAEWRSGWPTVICGTLGMMLIAAPMAVSGLVIIPVEQAFGWSRMVASSGPFMVTICSLLMAPFVGMAIRTFGIRQVALTGFGLFALGVVAIALTGPSASTWIIGWLLYGVLAAWIGPTIWTTAVNTRFVKSRGLALSVALSGSGIAYGLWPPVMAVAIDQYGWRSPFVLLAILSVAVLLPGAALLLRGQPDVVTNEVKSGATEAAEPPGSSVPLGSVRFWRLAISQVCLGASLGAMTIHFVPILAEQGFSTEATASLFLFFGPSMIAGRLLTGYLVDRVYAHWAAAAMAALPVATLIIILMAPSYPLLALGACLLGASSGSTMCSAAYLVAQHFGLKDFATTFGIVVGLYGLSFGLSPAIAGAFFDSFQTYRPLLAGFIVPLGLGVALLATLGRDRSATLSDGGAATRSAS